MIEMMINFNDFDDQAIFLVDVLAEDCSSINKCENPTIFVAFNHCPGNIQSYQDAHSSIQDGFIQTN